MKIFIRLGGEMREENVRNSITKNAIFKLILNIFNVIVPVIIGPYVARKLGSSILGDINYSQAIFAYFFIFAGFGIYNYGIREISRVRDDKEEVEKTFTNLFIITMVTNVLVSVIYIVFIKTLYSGTQIYTASIILSFNFLFNIFYTEWMNEALESYDFISIKTMIVRGVYFVLLFIFVKSVEDWKNYLYLLVLSNVLNNIISFIYIKTRVKFNFTKIEILKHIRPMFFVVILSNASVLYTQLDRIMIGVLINEEAVSFYTMAQNIIIVINSIALTLISVSIPRLSAYLSQNKNNEYLDLLDKISKIFFWFLFPASMGIVTLSHRIMPLYGGEDFKAATPILLMFGVYMIVLGYEYILSNQVLYLKGKEKIQVKFLFAGGFINLLLNIIAYKIDIFTPTIAVLTTMIATIVFTLMEYYYIRRVMKLDINLLLMNKSKYLLLSLGFIPIVVIVEKFINSEILIILIGIFMCTIYYYGILVLTKDVITMEMIQKIRIKVLSYKNN